MSTEDFVEHWKDTECFRALLADNYFKQVFTIKVYFLYIFTLYFIFKHISFEFNYFSKVKKN